MTARHQLHRLRFLPDSKRRLWLTAYLIPVIWTALVLVSCSVSEEPVPPECGSLSFVTVPTATRPRDPDLSRPPGPPPAGDGATYCPTPAGPATATPVPAEGFVATEVVNLSLDHRGQEVQAVAVGDDMLAVGWVEDGEVVVALARGGNHFQVRAVDRGSQVSLAFSTANRLHVAYEQDGLVRYRAADQGSHPADVPPLTVGAGQNPQVVVDELNWAHVLYERDGSLYKAKHLSGEEWYETFVAYGSDLTAIPFYNERELVLWGIPTGTYWFGLFLAAPYNGQVRLFRYLSWFNVWEQVAAFTIPPGEELLDNVGLDYHAASADEVWVYASWVTKRANTARPLPLYAQPIFEAVNPFYPDEIGNPHQIAQGLNAARWRSEAAPFQAGLRQTVHVPDPAGAIQLEAYGLAEMAGAADLTLRVGIDPTAGNSPDGGSVVWSAPQTPTSFSRFSVSAPAAGGTATLFLHATLDSNDTPATVVWDAVQTQNAAVENGSFEGPFVRQSTLTVPEGWAAYYEDGGNSPISGRDAYTVYGAWSRDGGASWSASLPVAANGDTTGSTTGAIGAEVYPVITTATEPPTVAFFYVYESGDPPAGTAFLRYGRPVMTTCTLGTTDCSTPPGTPLLARDAVRPSRRLLMAADPFHQERSLLIWDALQPDFASKDVYATYVAVR